MYVDARTPWIVLDGSALHVRMRFVSAMVSAARPSIDPGAGGAHYPVDEVMMVTTPVSRRPAATSPTLGFGPNAKRAP